MCAFVVVGFIFFHTKPRDWLLLGGRLQNDLFCIERYSKTLTSSVYQYSDNIMLVLVLTGWIWRLPHSAWQARWLDSKVRSHADWVSSARFVNQLWILSNYYFVPNFPPGMHPKYCDESVCDSTVLACLKHDMQRFFTKLMQKSFLGAYCNINPSV